MRQERVFGLDFLRASAVLLVLVSHASFQFIPLTTHLDASGISTDAAQHMMRCAGAITG
jgi:peptidoglycan/LPS O-acetylase OafA/YrhL